jgi:hypothetical protein
VNRSAFRAANSAKGSFCPRALGDEREERGSDSGVEFFGVPGVVGETAEARGEAGARVVVAPRRDMPPRDADMVGVRQGGGIEIACFEGADEFVVRSCENR